MFTGSFLHASGWRDGTKERRYEPRNIYREDGITLPVGRVHMCTKGHEVVNEILACFILFRFYEESHPDSLLSYHITGQLGISIFMKFKQFCLRIKPYGLLLKFIELCGVKDCTFPSLTEWQQSFSSPLPSPHAMSGCFLEDYWKESDL
jgi:hypothetical protein